MKIAKRAQLLLIGLEFFGDGEPMPGGHMEGPYMVFDEIDLSAPQFQRPPKLLYRARWRRSHRHPIKKPAH